MNRILLLSAMLFCLELHAQGTAEDYQRAKNVYQRFRSEMVTGTAEHACWTSPNSFTFALRTKDRLVNWTGRINENGDIMLEEDNQEESTQKDARHQQGNQEQKEWQAAPIHPVREEPQLIRNHWMNVDDEKWGKQVLSPDSLKVAFVRDYNVWVSDVDGRNARQLSFDGTLDHYYSSYLTWSPNGQYVATCKIKMPKKRFVYYVESSPTTQLQPIVHQQEYAKPGDEVKQRYPSVFEVSTSRAIVPENTLFPNPYSIHDLSWKENGQSLTFEYNERGHQTYRLLELNVETNQVRTLIEEKSNTFVNYNRLQHRTLSNGHQMIWQSERDNWAHLYLFDLDKGKLIRQLTKGEWVVRNIIHVDEEKGLVYFSASGMDKDEDPYHVHFYRIGLDGKGLVCLTPGNGTHSAIFNSDYTWLIDTYSRQDMAPITVIRHTDNPEEGREIGRGDLTELKRNGWVAPEIFHAPGRDGKTMMWGIIQRPSNFDPNRKYPIIEYIYAGPGDAYTPKAFLTSNYNTSSLAELGFIVVQLDGMGTSYRGKTFEDVCYKNLKDAGFPDRMEWIRAAARKYPYMDIDNVGIYGCSAGGQESTAAVLWHGDFYKAAYSACGCHDNRMDKIWWNEQWMGYPVDSAYVESSNVANASLLTRPLMLVVGELDDNVDPASTMQLANALIKAGKNFELVVIPGAHHTMGDAYGEHKRFDFFVKNLLKVDPPKWE